VFLEADRGTMTTKRFLTKMRGYWHYWDSGRARERYGMKHFVVLTATRTEERARNLRASTMRLDSSVYHGVRMFLFGSMELFTLDCPERIFEAVWQSAGDNGSHSLLE